MWNDVFPYDEVLLRCRMPLFHNPERAFCDAKVAPPGPQVPLRHHPQPLSALEPAMNKAADPALMQAAELAGGHSMAAYWMPFTANRQFKQAPRLLVRAEGMHYQDADGRQVLDGIAGLWCV